MGGFTGILGQAKSGTRLPPLQGMESLSLALRIGTRRKQPNMPTKTYHGYRKQMKKRLYSSSQERLTEREMRQLRREMVYTILRRPTLKEPRTT